MKLSKLIKYKFDPNVGTADRIFRVVSGASLAALPWTSFFNGIHLAGWR